MAQELRPGVFTALFNRLALKAGALGPSALTALALDIEREAKQNLAKTSHKYGEPTASRPGEPPSLVSGTLRRSITHKRPERIPLGWQVRVGVAAGYYPPYPKRGKRTRSSLYGLYLETGKLRNGAAYPFLVPAFRTVVGRTTAASLGRMLAADWASG